MGCKENPLLSFIQASVCCPLSIVSDPGPSPASVLDPEAVSAWLPFRYFHHLALNTALDARFGRNAVQFNPSSLAAVVKK